KHPTRIVRHVDARPPGVERPPALVAQKPDDGKAQQLNDVVAFTAADPGAGRRKEGAERAAVVSVWGSGVDSGVLNHDRQRRERVRLIDRSQVVGSEEGQRLDHAEPGEVLT